MALKLAIPGFKKSAGKAAGMGSTGSIERRFVLPLIGQMPIAKQLKWLGAFTAIAMFVTAGAAYMNNSATKHQAGYGLYAGGLELYSERLAKNAEFALTGRSAAFEDLDKARQDLSDTLQVLHRGNADLPPTSGEPRKGLDEIMLTAGKLFVDIDNLQNGRPGLVTLGRTIDAINLASTDFRSLGARLATSGSREQVSNFLLATERIAHGAAGLMSKDITLEDLALLGIDTYAAENALAAMPASDPNVQRAAELFEPYRNSVELLVGQSRSLVEAKAAMRSLEQNTVLIASQSRQLVKIYQNDFQAQVTAAIALLSGLLVLLLLLVISKEYLDDSQRRTKAAELANQKNQNAILRLMNELSDLADGDLTVRATVTEDITGAIADSVNYTAEELRKLVVGITTASEQMGRATTAADQVTKSLLVATQKQAHEIEEAGESVRLMTQSIQEVDDSAAKATEVGQRTLVATEKGAQAVRNTIAGMDGIREQIQETAKRIKRLGESSQEIGEIVDLISDITEQTNVLALNAAIQAASAGEAGRGFSVVAEEVQRLAERSGEATKQIASLVKAIQGDTHDAIAAMEKSTNGVVEGAKLSDVAGQSLKEIELVSNELAKLIDRISVTTHVQTDMVGQVSETMQAILTITGQTTEGTRLTADSVAQLNDLAVGLKGSVAGFKL
jgi:twitching motility protein PilJ